MFTTKKIVYFSLITFFLSFSFISCDEEAIEDLIADSLAALDSTDIVNTDSTSNTTGEGTVTSTLEVNLDKTQILNLVNEHRAAGTDCKSRDNDAMGDLVWNDELAKAALDHSIDMATNNYFSHTGLNGSNFSERARAAGYTGGLGGENIARGQRTEESVIQAWMDSDGHCKNIMNSGFKEIGIARSETGNYWTMVLGRGN